MKTNKILSLALAGVMALALAVPAFATSGQIQNTTGTGTTTIPVNISANATVFDVTLPTAFPTTVDPETGATVASDTVEIVNSSSGKIYVSNITVNANNDTANGRSWTLADYDADLRNGNVDANLVGIMITPTGGENATKTGGANGNGRLATKNGGASEVLLSTASPDWIIGAKDTDSARDELGITYLTNATPVSSNYSGQVASIVITVAWYTEGVAHPATS